MRTNFPLVLAAIAVGFGVGEGSASNLDLKPLSGGASGQAIHALDPSLGQGAGFSALRSLASTLKGAASLKGVSSPLVSPEALVRPEEGHAWRSGFAAVASKDIASQAAIVGAPEMGGSNGFAALKPAGERSAAAPDRLSGRQNATQDPMLRPAGTQWSEGFQALRQ
jgi:hypothetical protein